MYDVMYDVMYDGLVILFMVMVMVMIMIMIMVMYDGLVVLLCSHLNLISSYLYLLAVWIEGQREKREAAVGATGNCRVDDQD